MNQLYYYLKILLFIRLLSDLCSQQHYITPFITKYYSITILVASLIYFDLLGTPN